MKITKTQLKQMIKEEITKSLKEDDWAATDKHEITSGESVAKINLLQQAREDFEKEMDADAEWYAGWDEVAGSTFEPIEVLRAKISEWAAESGASETSKKYSN